MNIISGTTLAKEMKAQLTLDIATLKTQYGRSPKIALVLVGEDGASVAYVRSKEKTCAELDIESDMRHLPENISQQALLAIIEELNQTLATDAILVQLPLPKHIDTQAIINAIDVRKDVDGLHPVNMGKLFTNEKTILPCTPRGILSLLKRANVKLSGKNAVVLGRSHLVGNPTAQLLLREDATVTICHSKSRNLTDIVQQADILISAMGSPGIITPDMLKKGVVIIDVAINYVDGRLCGDIYMPAHLVDLEKKVMAITPIPGGVGPMTIVSLMQNTFDLYRQANTHIQVTNATY